MHRPYTACDNWPCDDARLWPVCHPETGVPACVACPKSPLAPRLDASAPSPVVSRVGLVTPTPCGPVNVQPGVSAVIERAGPQDGVCVSSVHGHNLPESKPVARDK